MSEATADVDFEELARVVEADDETFKRDLGKAVEGFHEDDVIETLLLDYPDTYEALSTRLATVDAPEDIAESDPEAIEQTLRVMYRGINEISKMSPEVREAVTSDYTVNWQVEEYDLGWHLQTDSSTGHVNGGPTLVDDPTLTFIGSLDVMLSMTGDEDFNGTLAFIQNKFEIIGPLQKARELDSMMDSVFDNARELS